MKKPLIEMEIERRLAELIAPVVDLPVYCFWGDMASGSQRTMQRSHVAIKANPRSVEIFSNDVMQVLVVINLALSTEDQFTGANFVDLWREIMEQLTDIAGCEGDSSDISTEYVFSATGVEMQEGGECSFDDVSKSWWATITLAVHGVKDHTEPPEETEQTESTEETEGE